MFKSTYIKGPILKVFQGEVKVNLHVQVTLQVQVDLYYRFNIKYITFDFRVRFNLHVQVNLFKSSNIKCFRVKLTSTSVFESPSRFKSTFITGSIIDL